MGQLALSKRDARFHQGRFFPKHIEKFAGKEPFAYYRSGLELKYFRVLDENPNVVKWGSEEAVVPYYFNNGWHKYFIDLFVMFRVGNEVKKYFIELKPANQTKEPKWSARRKKENYLYECKEWAKNQAKWKAATSFAEQNGWKFIVLSEKDLKQYGIT